MELVSNYVYNRAPVQTENISNLSFHQLKQHNWYNDTRSNVKYTMLNKRFFLNGQWYRAMIRFEKKGILDSKEYFSLSQPSPFLITECNRLESLRYEDTKTFHGPKLGSISNMIVEGVPTELIELIYSDLKEYIKYI